MRWRATCLKQIPYQCNEPQWPAMPTACLLTTAMLVRCLVTARDPLDNHNTAIHTADRTHACTVQCCPCSISCAQVRLAYCAKLNMEEATHSILTCNHQQYKCGNCPSALPGTHLRVLLPATQLPILQCAAYASKSEKNTVNCSCCPYSRSDAFTKQPSWPNDQKCYNCAKLQK